MAQARALKQPAPQGTDQGGVNANCSSTLIPRSGSSWSLAGLAMLLDTYPVLVAIVVGGLAMIVAVLGARRAGGPRRCGPRPSVAVATLITAGFSSCRASPPATLLRPARVRLVGGSIGTWLGPQADATPSYAVGVTAKHRPKESVWDYPRPPRVEPEPRRVRIELGGETIADSTRALRVLETASPPTIYVPREDVRDRAAHRRRGPPHGLRVEGARPLPRTPRPEARAPSPPPGTTRIPRTVRAAVGPHRVLRRPGRRLLPRRRARHPAGRTLLRRLGHRRDRGPLQGRARHRGLVRRWGGLIRLATDNVLAMRRVAFGLVVAVIRAARPGRCHHLQRQRLPGHPKRRSLRRGLHGARRGHYRGRLGHHPAAAGDPHDQPAGRAEDANASGDIDTNGNDDPLTIRGTGAGPSSGHDRRDRAGRPGVRPRRAAAEFLIANLTITGGSGVDGGGIRNAAPS